jgi:hypothetical protein
LDGDVIASKLTLDDYSMDLACGAKDFVYGAAVK